MPVDIVIDGLEELRGKLDRFPKAAQDGAGNMVSDYVLNVMKEYVPYAYVPFKSAYGDWFSDKQRKYVMARIHEGSIRPGAPSRTQTLRGGWTKMGEGADTLFCGRRKDGDRPYCTECARVAFKPFAAKEPKNANQLAMALRRYAA